MEVIGKIIVALPEASGTSKAGNQWKKRSYVLETLDNYPTKIAFEFFGERADQYPLSVGDEVKLSFDIDSHEYNGRWFTSIRGWKAEKTGANVELTTQHTQNTEPFDKPQTQPEAFTPSTDPNDDLPF